MDESVFMHRNHPATDRDANLGPLFPEINVLQVRNLARSHPCGWLSCRLRFINWTRDSFSLLSAVSANRPIISPCPRAFCRMCAGLEIRTHA